MIEHRPFASLGHADHGWLKAAHHFSFAGYHDPARMGWGKLRVWNDDRIAPASGFPPHGHRDMEIVTYVRSGAISHRDSMGNEGRTGAGDVQVMSAGRGIQHAEYNAEDEATTLFQIWIEPRTAGGDPFWNARRFPARGNGGFSVLASGYESDEGALPIRADGRLMAARLRAGDRLTHSFGDKFGDKAHAYLVGDGSGFRVGDIEAGPRDGFAIRGESDLVVEATGETDLILVETY